MDRDRDREIEHLELRISELEQKIEHLRFSRRVLLNLLEKVIMDQKTSEMKIIKFNPSSRQT